MKKIVNVVILTGFLGSGKTTLLNHLLRSAKDKRNFVVENEFGKVSIDGALVEQQYRSELFELSNGCICCSLDEDLYDVLNDIAQLPERPDNLFVEASGVADASNLISIFMRDDVRRIFLLQKTVCVVDVETIEDNLETTDEAGKQIVAADVIVLNKLPFVSPEYASKVSSLVKSLNPFAQVIESKDGSIPLSALETETPLREAFEPEVRQVALGGRVSKHRIVSIYYHTNHAFDKAKLMHLLTATLVLYAEQIYRVKGFVQLEGSTEKYLVQSAGKKVRIEPFGAWEATDGEALSEIVVIGRGIVTKTIERLMHGALADSVAIERES